MLIWMSTNQQERKRIMQHRSNVWYQGILSVAMVGVLGLASPSWAKQGATLDDVVRTLQDVTQRLSAIEQALATIGTPTPTENPLDATVQICARLGGSAGLQGSLGGSAGLGIQGTVGADVFGNGVTVNPGVQGQLGLSGSLGGETGLDLTVCFRGVTVARQTPLSPSEQTFVQGLTSTGREFQHVVMALADSLGVVKSDGTSLLMAALESVQNLQQLHISGDPVAFLRGEIEQNGPFQELIATLPLFEVFTDVAESVRHRLPAPLDPVKNICNNSELIPTDILQSVTNLCQKAEQLPNIAEILGDLPHTLNGIEGSVSQAVDGINQGFNAVSTEIHSVATVVNTEVNGAKAAVITEVNGVKSAVTTAMDTINQGIGQVQSVLTPVHDQLFNLSFFVTDVYNAISGQIATVNTAVNGVKTAVDAVKTVIDSVCDHVLGC